MRMRNRHRLSFDGRSDAQMSLVKLLFPTKNSQMQSKRKFFVEWRKFGYSDFFWLRMAVSRRKNLEQPPYSVL